jgi:rhamnopyranosyl-N-acetylglucosaminyl-diphospho-decaprenol beta-1,3/1,4-galactofuranosyltransferase
MIDNSLQRIAIVIVTFNNAGMLRNLLFDCAAQSLQPVEIAVVDNASSDETPRMMTEEFPYVHYIRLAENTGSAGGYYTGIKEVMATADGIWTLDDDVRLEPGSLENLVRGYTELAKKYRLGAVRSVGAGHPQNGCVELEIVPWRGALWVGDVVRLMGPPRSDYFMYGEDIEYSFRMRKMGYCCYWVPSSQCREVRKGKTDGRVFGRPVRIYPTPFRLYYAFRNEINICLTYYRIDKLARLCLFTIKVIGYVALTERTGGHRKITAVLIGLWHGLIGRLGKNPRYLP